MGKIEIGSGALPYGLSQSIGPFCSSEGGEALAHVSAAALQLGMVQVNKACKL